MRPSPNDYAEYYAKYIEMVKADNALNVLEKYNEIVQVFRSVPGDRENFSYAPGKWTLKQVLGHINETERIMAYRALRISRNDYQPLPGFDQNEYIKYGGSQRREMKDLIDEFEAIRKSNLYLFRSLSEEELERKGNASGYEITVLALMFIIAGHALHHTAIVKERYL